MVQLKAGHSEQETSSVKKEIERPVPTKMCWADVSESTDSLDALEEKVMQQSVESMDHVNEIVLPVEESCTSADANRVPLDNNMPEVHDEEEDDDDENYEDIESNASEEESTRDDVPESEEEEADDVPDNEKQAESSDEDVDEDESSSDQPTKPLDDDEDMRKPQYIPKRGAFYEHDDRLGSDEEVKVGADGESVTSEGSQPKSVKQLTISNKKSNPQRPPKEQSDTKVVSIDSDRWGHDMFREEEQKPKSREELLTSYGYDIRSQDSGPPKNVRYNKRGVTQSRNNRNWKDENDRSPQTGRRNSEEAVKTKVNAPSDSPASGASRASEKIAMREAHQASEKRRYERESKPLQRESLQRTTHRPQDPVNRRSYERSDRRTDAPNTQNPVLRRPFTRDDFPELQSNRPPADHTQKRRDEPIAWNRTITNNNSSRRRDQSSDESQERPVVRTQVVYSSSRFSKDRSPKPDTHPGHNSSNGNQRTRYQDRNDRQDYRQSGNFRKPPPVRQNEPSSRTIDQEGRTDKGHGGQRGGRREYPSERPPHRQSSVKEEAVPVVPDPVPDLSAGMQKVSIDQRNNQRRVPDVIESENRPKRYSATRSQSVPQPTNMPEATTSHHSGVPRQQIGQQISTTQPAVHPYYEPSPQSPAEYYADADGPAYPAYGPADAFITHHRYIPSHAVPGPPNPLTAPSAPMTVMPAPAAAFLPTFTPSLPPSGFPQYPPPPQQYHHAMGPPVAGPTGAPATGSEMFRGGVTYYDTTQQQPIRSLPPKRPKNIIPILPPPGTDGHGREMTHPDGANAGY